MAIIDYKEKYKQALEVAQRFYNNSVAITKKGLEDIFPELKESEDEKIKNDIITYLSTVEDKEFIPYESWIAWLEKQGEQKPVVIIPKFRVGDEIKTVNEESLTITKIDEKGYWSKDLFICGFDDAAKWELVEQTADKVEPKFHKGEWVIDKQGIVHRIANAIENVTNHTYGYDIIGGGYFNDDTEGVRLWTIQDAKDGDVLINDFHLIFIFKEIKNNMYISHCSIIDRGNNDVIVNSIIDREVGDVNLVKCQPATKEQRDALMKAMADAGYTFDFEKKELKKIEQKPAYTKEYDFHGITFIPKFAKGDIIKDKKCGEVSTIEDFSYDTGLYTHTYGQFPITIQDNYEIIEQESAWSEEDRQTLRLIIDDLSEELNDEPDEADKEILCRKISFLNSLKPQPIHKWDREDNKIKVEITNYLECQKREEPTRKDILNKWISWIASLNPQCKQCSTTWSGEDERRRKRIVERLENIRKSKEDNIDVASVILSEIEWLKSLKDRVLPQPEQKWSEEDERNLNDAILFIETGTYSLDKDNLINWLKSLRPQNTWKPSDEQIEMLENVRKILHTNKDIYSKANNLMYNFEELIRTLKKLRED